MLIGAGNVAHHIGKRFVECGFSISYVISRNIKNANKLTEIIGGVALDSIPNPINSVDLIVISVNDSEYQGIIQKLNPDSNILVLHTSGSIALDVFDGKNFDYGVLYPFQTFSKNREVDFAKVPLFIEAKNEVIYRKIEKIACKLSEKVLNVSSLERSYIHLAAVFACNFVNHLLVEAKDILDKQNIDFSVLKPLIIETINKAMETSPFEAQTGPAIRNDENIIQKHLSLLDNEKQKELYLGISNLIIEKHSKNDKL